MKKSSFVAMVLGTVSGVLFALGMCMALLPEWNAFKPGIVFGCVGLLLGIITVIIWRKMEGKQPVHLSGKSNSDRSCWHYRCSGAWHRYVFLHGMGTDGAWYCHWTCWYHCSALPDSLNEGNQITCHVMERERKSVCKTDTERSA